MTPRILLLSCLAVSGLILNPAAADETDPHAKHRQMAQQQSEASQDRIVLPDTLLITQHGDELRLDSDIVAGRIVIIDFVYTYHYAFILIIILNFISIPFYYLNFNLKDGFNKPFY